MNKQLTSHRVPFLLSIIVYAMLCSMSISTVSAQPPTMRKYVDDLELCRNVVTDDTQKAPLGLRQFCKLAKGADPNTDKATRNDLIDLVIGQIDEDYRDHKNGIRTGNKILQTILDILEVGASTAIDIIKGERAKTVIAAGLTGLKGGRSSFNKNFEVLQMQVLINKMNADRADVQSRIIRNKEKAAGEYRWLQAKNDLRDYFIAGTFGNALDSLVKTTSNEADDAEEILKGLKENAGISLAPTAEEYKAALSLDNSLAEIEAPYEAASEKEKNAETKYKEAENNIADANKETPINDKKIAEWTPQLTKADEDRKAAATERKALRDRVKNIYDTAVMDPSIKEIMGKIPVKYARFAASINDSQTKISNGTGTFEDYYSILSKLNGVALDHLSKSPQVLVKIKNLIEATKK